MTDKSEKFEPYNPLTQVDAFKERQKVLAAKAKVESKRDAVRINKDGAIIGDTSDKTQSEKPDTEDSQKENTVEDAQSTMEEEPMSSSNEEVNELETETSESSEIDNISNNSNFEKRYHDLQSHHNRKINELLEEQKKLQSDLEKAKAKSLDILSEGDLDSMFKEYPDLAKAIESKVYHSLRRQSKELDEKLKVLEEKQLDVERENNFSKLLKIHPDVKELTNTDKFKEWYESQPSGIQSLVNSVDVDEVSAAITKFKTDIGLTKTRSKKKSKQISESLAVKKSSKDTKQISKGKKIWKESEIAKLSLNEYQKNEADIMEAMNEGRIEYDSHNRYTR